MQYAACRVPAAPVYKEPTHRSEMVNQLLFGEKARVEEEGKYPWVRITSTMDGYEGWLSIGMLENIHQIQVFNEQRGPAIAQPFTLIHLPESSMIIPFGASLLGLEIAAAGLYKKERNYGLEMFTVYPQQKNYRGRFGNFTYTYKNDDGKKPLNGSIDEIEKLTRLWLNAPYLWGGRTLTGVDCSGFAQTIYKVLGIHIPRDAWQQALKGRAVSFLQEVQAGDLAFFDDEEGKIIHVGILLNEHEIIHAAGGTGKIQVDKIDNEGIVRSDNGVRSHRLRIIKRYFSKEPLTGTTLVYV